MAKTLSKSTLNPDTFSIESYGHFLREIKEKIRSSQIKAAAAINKELIQLYWDLGKNISYRQKLENWGNSIIEKIAQDLENSFPGIKGFSRANLFRMKRFYQSYEKVAQAVRQFDELPLFSIPWGHNITLFEKIESLEERLWYAQKTIDNGWSRNVLNVWIKSNLYAREGKAITNFKKALAAPQTDLAEQTLKDPYCFDFLTLTKPFLEKELEQGLIDHIQNILIGNGHNHTS